MAPLDDVPTLATFGDLVPPQARELLRDGKLPAHFRVMRARELGQPLARLLAAAVNCAQRADANPCGTCPSCVATLRSGGVALVEVDGRRVTVGQLRKLRKSLTAEQMAGWTVVAIYGADAIHGKSTLGVLNDLLKATPPRTSVITFLF